MVQGIGSSGNFKWDDNYGGGEAPASSEQLQNSESLKRDIGGSSCELHISEAANKRLKQTPLDSAEKVQLSQILLSLGPLGLTLGRTPSFIDLTEMSSPQKNKTKCAPEINHNALQMMTEKEKLKASNFNASLLIIGSWQRASQNDGDLVVKCYFAKRKLVWEILDQGLKSKIEIQWSDILAMRAAIEENHPGILEIELGQPPSFHRESNPQPRKHTMWNAASDFTNGQALINRRHYIQFPPGVLDKHYEKLIQCDRRFFELSQRPFPSRRSPYFQSDCNNGVAEFSFHFDRHGSEIPSNGQLPYSSYIPMHTNTSQQIQTYEQTKPSVRIKDSTSPISVMDLTSPSDEVISNQGVENPPMLPYWDQGITRAMPRFAEYLGREQVNPVISYQNFNLYNQGPARTNLESRMLSNIKNQLLIDSQVQFSNTLVIPQANSLIGFPEQVNSATATGTRHTDYGHEMTGNMNLDPGATVDVSQPHPVSWVVPPPPQPASWVVPPQGTPRNSEIQMAENNSMYSSFPQNPTMERVANFNNWSTAGMIHKDE